MDRDCEYKTQELFAERDGNRIYGVIYIPQNAGKKMPAVIISHGFGGSYRVGVTYNIWTAAVLFKRAETGDPCRFKLAWIPRLIYW